MSIPTDQYPVVRSIDVNEHATRYEYAYWETHFEEHQKDHLIAQVQVIRVHLGPAVRRRDLVDFYKIPTISAATKFIATMMWGFEAPAAGRRAGYGPHRVSEMFTDPHGAGLAISGVRIANDGEIANSYNSLNRALKKCGPNFFTKHFYFLGKAMYGEANRLLIFDDRVANGLLKLFPANHSLLGLLKVGAMRTAHAYIEYLNYVSAQAAAIGCPPDHVEYYLFTL